MRNKIITRFAPSPTGFLHIGGARTALFNWIYAKKYNGKMLLRIEDTDRKRSNKAAIDAILDGLNWLGIKWDGEPVSQYANRDRHIEVANILLEKKLAYKCYCSPEKIEKMRKIAREQGLSPKYDGTCRNLDDKKIAANISPTIRLKIEANKDIIIDDKVQGKVKINSNNIDDFILVRSDGSPTYMLAVVVDDYDMGITHIIRGDDHLTNAARQICLYSALGWKVPQMAHIPLIHGADGAKLSKRHGALGVDEYRKMGYLANAIINYLARLGWSHGDDEIFSVEQFIKWFDLDGLNKGAARFDFNKLTNINAHYIKNSDVNFLYENMLALANELNKQKDINGLIEKKELILKALPLFQTRAKTIIELIEQMAFFYAEQPLKMEQKAKELLNEENEAKLNEVRKMLEELSDWSVENIKILIKQFAAEREQNLGKIAQPLRAALCGSTSSPSIFDIMALLGKEESLSRIKRVIID